MKFKEKILSTLEIGDLVKIIVDEIDQHRTNKVYFAKITEKGSDYIEIIQKDKIKVVIDIKFIISISKEDVKWK